MFPTLTSLYIFINTSILTTSIFQTYQKKDTPDGDNYKEIVPNSAHDDIMMNLYI